MSEQIEDGTGKGYRARVSDKNKLEVLATNFDLEKSINLREGKAWSVNIVSASANVAGGYFFYLKNNGANPLIITDFRFQSNLVSEIIVRRVTGNPTFRGAGTPQATSRNFGVTLTPTATLQTCTSATGLTNEGTIYYLEQSAGNVEFQLNTTSGIILPQGTALALTRTGSAGAVTGIISLVELTESVE